MFLKDNCPRKTFSLIPLINVVVRSTWNLTGSFKMDQPQKNLHLGITALNYEFSKINLTYTNFKTKMSKTILKKKKKRKEKITIMKQQSNFPIKCPSVV